jgi:hypothetical protein
MPPRSNIFPAKSIQPPFITVYMVVIAITSKQSSQLLPYHRDYLRLCNCARISLSAALIRLLMVILTTTNIPLLVYTQKCVNPRKSKVSSFSSPRFLQPSIADQPNRSSRVFS